MSQLGFIETPNAPLPAGHYSQAVKHQGVLYLAGQLPIVPGSKEKVEGSIEEQTLQTLKNIEAVLLAGGSGRNQVLRVTVFISDITLWGKVNEVFTAFFGSHKPARSVVPVNTLHYGYQIEMEVTAGCA